MKDSTDSGFFSITCSHLTHSLDDLISFHHSNLLPKSTFLTGNCFQAIESTLAKESGFLCIFQRVQAKKLPSQPYGNGCTRGNNPCCYPPLNSHLRAHTTASACTQYTGGWPSVALESWMPPPLYLPKDGFHARPHPHVDSFRVSIL